MDVISGITNKVQFQYLNGLKGTQEGTYLYETKFIFPSPDPENSVREGKSPDKAIFYLAINVFHTGSVRLCPIASRGGPLSINFPWNLRGVRTPCPPLDPLMIPFRIKAVMCVTGFSFCAKITI